MSDQRFSLQSDYEPAGDQPQAIDQLTTGLKTGLHDQTLLGVTGSGKTFTIANVIEKVQKPTLVIAHNKTLAAQLASEFRTFFPDSAVEYFVSYFDYYQPEAYLPGTDTYIEKESDVNQEIDRLRHAATAALLTRRDTIIVASVSCIYGLGSPQEYEEQHLLLAENNRIKRDEFLARLISMHYGRSEVLRRGSFRAHGSTIEIMPPDRETVVRVEIEGNSIASIEEFDGLTRELMKKHMALTIFPAKHFVVSAGLMDDALRSIETELEDRLGHLEREGKILEAERLERRTRYDLELIRELGYCNGIENYSRFLTGRAPGQAPYTLLDFFPKDFLLVIDESHVTVPQIGGMYEGDRSRKTNLIEYGFRLPSALDNRPLKFDEFERKMNQVIYVSATPGQYELAHSRLAAQRLDSKNENSPSPISYKLKAKSYAGVAEQIVRPTGLIDPEIIVRPARDQIKNLLVEIEPVIARNERVLVTTLTKKQAEQLTEFLTEKQMKVGFLHSEVNTLDRIAVLNELRRGDIDILVGVNLLREGLDLPEVSLVAILDADKEGFLRSETSLIQTMGRAARNVRGRVVLYADAHTGSMNRAIAEAERRRTIQLAYNERHGITPQSIRKAIAAIVDHELKPLAPAKEQMELIDIAEVPRMIRDKEREMRELAKSLKFEEAALVRDEIIELKRFMKK